MYVLSHYVITNIKRDVVKVTRAGQLRRRSSAGTLPSHSGSRRSSIHSVPSLQRHGSSSSRSRGASRASTPAPSASTAVSVASQPHVSVTLQQQLEQYGYTVATAAEADADAVAVGVPADSGSGPVSVCPSTQQPVYGQPAVR